MPFVSHMDAALSEARAAAARGEVPVGAVVVAPDGRVVAVAGNRTREMNDPTAHAEILAIRAACAALGSERLTGHDLYVTLEPCPMCAAAISFARIGRLYYGAADPKSGGIAQGPRVFSHPQCHHAPEVYDGIAADESATVLRAFFATRRDGQARPRVPARLTIPRFLGRSRTDIPGPVIMPGPLEEPGMILTCGEALIDMLPRTTTEGEPAFAPYAGGAVFNTAIALGRLGAPSAFFSGLSTDMLGEILTQTLDAAHVDSSFAARSGRPTTVAFVKLVNGQATYAFYDENTAGRMLSPEDLPVLPDDMPAIFFGGICLVHDPAASTYAALQAREAPKRVTMLDPNVRPGFITDRAAYLARINRMIDLADIVKLSDEDLHWIMGDGDLATLARGILARGPKLVCITEGSKGATAYSAGHTVHVAATPVTVADTVGAGDTFNAGVLCALWRADALTKDRIATLDEATIRDALNLGVRAAAITVSRPGANPPWAHEL